MLGSQVQPEDDQSPPIESDVKGEEAGVEETHEQKIARACRELRELKKQKREQDGEKKPPATTGLENRFGRLVVDEGRSRYINPSFWASLSSEVGKFQSNSSTTRLTSSYRWMILKASSTTAKTKTLTTHPL